MRPSIISALLAAGASVVSASSGWNFEDGSISVSGKNAAGTGFKDKLSNTEILQNSVKLGPTDTLKLILTATDNGSPKRPHQAFLLLRDWSTKLETSFTFSMKESGKGKLEITQKDLPIQLLTASQSLQAVLMLGSFGQSEGYGKMLFRLEVESDPNAPPVPATKPERYGKKEVINHIFKADAQSPPKIVSMVFTLAVLATLPVLLGVWLYLGANLNQLSKALSAAPIAHSLCFCSLIAMEGLFLAYYWRITLFELLPRAGVVGIIGFLSGSKALSEVQARRMAGDR